MAGTKWTTETERLALLSLLYAHAGGIPKIDDKIMKQLAADLAPHQISAEGAR